MRINPRHLARRFKLSSWEQFLRSKNVVFENRPSYSGYWPHIENRGAIFLGENVKFRSHRLRHHISALDDAILEIGHNTFLNDGVSICAKKSVIIGNNVLIGDMTSILDSDFHQVSPDMPVKSLPVFIGNNVWIGANSMILAGTSIGDHSVLAAGSIVVGKIPAKTLAAGSPARVVKEINIPDGWVRG